MMDGSYVILGDIMQVTRSVNILPFTFLFIKAYLLMEAMSAIFTDMKKVFSSPSWVLRTQGMYIFYVG